jgi:predicted nucleic acid-binding protein
MTKSKKVFLASSAFFALIDRNHPKHSNASAYFRYFVQEKYYLYTGYVNLAEAYRLIFANLGPSLAREFLRALSSGSINILYPTESDMKAAIKTIVTSQSPDLTFKDAQMAVLSYRNNISYLLSFDYVPPLFGLTTFSLPF